MKSLLGPRFFFGLMAAVVLLVIFVVHATALNKIDNIGVGLIVGIIAAVTFALSEQMGITKLTAGPLSVEIAERAKKAGQAIPDAQRGAVENVLTAHSHLFPVVGARVLWVDDNPQIVIPHRQLLRRLGIQVVAVRSTQEAKQQIEMDSDFALIIQDRERRNDTKDAKCLIEWLRNKGGELCKAPLIIYSFDKFDATLNVPRHDWFEKDFGALLRRVLVEIEDWTQRSVQPAEKPP
jgi:CheY-like chemotaxis protein